jgi:MerR family mercuric resistance operon transcriptional regulator
MKIGQVADRAGVHVETIRYYQHLGLMPRPARAPGSVRRYGVAAVERLTFIKRAQSLGFSLEEVRTLLDLAARRQCAETRMLAQQKLGVIERKIADLRQIERVLGALVSACGDSNGNCPIIDSLVADARACAAASA